MTLIQTPIYTLRVHEWSYDHCWDKTWEKSFDSSQDLEVAIANLPPEGEIKRHIERIRHIPKPKPRGYAHKEF